MKFTKEERSWVLYDWANSAYTIIVTTAIFPLYYRGFVGEENYVATWAFANSIGSLLLALSAPFLGALADYPGVKKRFFLAFLALGVGTTTLLGLPIYSYWLPLLVVYVASLFGFSGANLFYDAMLVDVTDHDRMIRVSSARYAWGYIGGSTIPFVIAIVTLSSWERIGFSGQGQAFRAIMFLTAAWWLVFSLPLIRNVRQRYALPRGAKPFAEAVGRLRETFRNIGNYRVVFLFLGAYFFYIEGVNTIIRMATPIGIAIGIPQTTLVMILLVIQIVAFPFALLYGRLAQRFSDRRMIFVAIAIYIMVVFVAFFLPSFPATSQRVAMFWVLGMLVASSQGGIQALSRSYFAKIIPREASSEFFGFYNMMGKFASIIGPFLVGAMTLITGQERFGILSVLLLFAVGILLLHRTPQSEEVAEAPPPAI